MPFDGEENLLQRARLERLYKLAQEQYIGAQSSWNTCLFSRAHRDEVLGQERVFALVGAHGEPLALAAAMAKCLGVNVGELSTIFGADSIEQKRARLKYLVESATTPATVS